MGLFEAWFLHDFPRRVFPQDRAAARRVRRKARQLAAADEPPDRAGRAIILYCATVLAAWHELRRQGLTPEAARDRLVEPFRMAAGGRWVGLGMRWMLRLTGGRRLVQRMSAERIARGYGALFRFAEERGPEGVTSIVLRCGFHDWLTRHDAAELTPVFCAWDWLWAAEIDPDRHGIRFERPATIAEGAPACRFEFRIVRPDDSP